LIFFNHFHFPDSTSLLQNGTRRRLRYTDILHARFSGVRSHNHSDPLSSLNTTDRIAEPHHSYWSGFECDVPRTHGATNLKLVLVGGRVLWMRHDVSNSHARSAFRLRATETAVGTTIMASTVRLERYEKNKKRVHTPSSPGLALGVLEVRKDNKAVVGGVIYWLLVLIAEQSTPAYPAPDRAFHLVGFSTPCVTCTARYSTKHLTSIDMPLKAPILVFPREGAPRPQNAPLRRNLSSAHGDRTSHAHASARRGVLKTGSRDSNIHDYTN
jgi:hypothetical protein